MAVKFEPLTKESAMCGRVLLVTWSVLGLAGLWASPLGAQEVSATNFDKLGKLIKPTVAESGWSEIPWMLDLNAARHKAAAEGKPLFVWTMSGEPLGQC